MSTVDDTNANLGVKRTSRGFAYLEFTDTYHCQCSLQDSSSAEEYKIWLGMDKDSKGNPVGPIDPVSGHHISTRMHLNRELIVMLQPYLQRFVESGSIAASTTITNGTPDALYRARESLANITPGEWTTEQPFTLMDSGLVMTKDGDCIARNVSKPDAAFIASAPALVRDLVAKVRETVVRVEQMQAEVGRIVDKYQSSDGQYTGAHMADDLIAMLLEE